MHKDNKFKEGEIVKTIYGEKRTVLRQSGVQVFVKEEVNSWYHPQKLFKLKDLIISSQS